MRTATPDQLTAMTSLNKKPLSHVVFRDSNAHWGPVLNQPLVGYSYDPDGYEGVAPYAPVDSCYYNGYIYKAWRDGSTATFRIQWIKINVDTLAATTGSFLVDATPGFNIRRLSVVNNEIYYLYAVPGSGNYYVYKYNIDTSASTNSGGIWLNGCLAVTDDTSTLGRRRYVFGPTAAVGDDANVAIAAESGSDTVDETRMTLLNRIANEAFVFGGNTNWFDVATAEDGTYDVVIFNSLDGGSPRAMIVDVDTDGGLVGRRGVWDIVPADIVDNYTFFRLGWIKRIGDTFYATGRAGRGGSTGLHAQSWDVLVRSKDGIHWTLDRYQYLCEKVGHGPIMEGPYLLYGGVETARMFLMVSDDLYESSQNHLFGRDPTASKITVSDDLHSWSYSKGLSTVDSGNVALDNSAGTFDGVQPGWLASLYGGFNNEELLLATMSVDEIPGPFANGQSQYSVKMRGTAMKKLSDWASDQDWQWLSGIRHYEDCDDVGGLYTINGNALSAPPDEPLASLDADWTYLLSYSDVGVNYHQGRGISLNLATVGKIDGDHYISADFCDYGQRALCFGSDETTDIPPGSSCGVLTNVVDKDNFWASTYNFHDITHKVWRVENGVWDKEKDITVPSATVAWRNSHKSGAAGDPYVRVYYNLSGNYITTGIVLGPGQLVTTREYGDIILGTDQITREKFFVGDVLAPTKHFVTGKVGAVLANDFPAADTYLSTQDAALPPTFYVNRYVRDINDWTEPAGGYDDQTHTLSTAEKTRTSLDHVEYSWYKIGDEANVFCYGDGDVMDSLPPGDVEDDRSGCYQVSAVAANQITSTQHHTRANGSETWTGADFLIYILTGDSAGKCDYFTTGAWNGGSSTTIITRSTGGYNYGYDYTTILAVGDKFVLLPRIDIARRYHKGNDGFQTIEMPTDGTGVNGVVIYENKQEYNLDFVVKNLAAKAGILDVCGATTDDDTDTTYSQAVHINDSLAKHHEFRAVDETAHINWDADVSWDIQTFAIGKTQRSLMFAFLRQKQDAKLLTTDLAADSIGIIVDVVIDTSDWHVYLYDTYAGDGPILRDYTTGALTNISTKDPAAVRIVKRDRCVSVYFNDQYLGSVTSRPISSVYAAEASGHVYHDEVWNGFSYLHVGSVHDVIATVTIKELNDYVDNLILDQRMSAQSGLARLFQDKRVYLSATPDEALRVTRFAARDTTEIAGDLFLSGGITLRDRVPTHVRAIGEEIGDYVNHAAAAERGMQFMSINTPTLGEEEAYQEAVKLVLDALGEADTMNPEMAGRLHWEPGDKVPISYTDLKGTVVDDDYLVVGLNTTHNDGEIITQARVRKIVAA